VKARVAVVQFPGVNCEAESVRALERSGLGARVFAWTLPATELRDADAYVVPGGFSYQDRVRGGALAAKDPLVELLAEEADRGKPVLGICNGAQVLVEAGLVPDSGAVELALARNTMPDRDGYYAGWVYVRVEESPCVFTAGLAPGTVLPMPVAHGEGRFASADKARLESLVRRGQAPLRYCDAEGALAQGFPDNPNGSPLAIAAICNRRGNVLAVMPHPERAQDLGSLARDRTGAWGARWEEWAASPERPTDAAGPGLALFEGLRRYLERA
jgi:phosphoribosylformylglycinamidine synthase